MSSFKKFWEEKRQKGINTLQRLTDSEFRHPNDVDAKTIQALRVDDIDKINVINHADLIETIKKILILSKLTKEEHNGLQFGEWTLKQFKSVGESDTLYRDSCGPTFAVLSKVGTFQHFRFIKGRRWYWWGGWLDQPAFREALDKALTCIKRN